MKKSWAAAVAAVCLALVLTSGPRVRAAGGVAIDADNFPDPVFRAYVQTLDADGDGVCDNRTDGARAYVDADGDGFCDNRTGGARAYVDADGDGVCDNRTDGGRHGGGHHGWGRGCRG